MLIKCVSEFHGKNGNGEHLRKECNQCRYEWKKLRNNIKRMYNINPHTGYRIETLIKNTSNTQIPPNTNGIYFLLNNEEIEGIKISTITYIGQSSNILHRVGTHANNKQFNAVGYIEVPKHLNLDVIERFFILTFNPINNKAKYEYVDTDKSIENLFEYLNIDINNYTISQSATFVI